MHTIGKTHRMIRYAVLLMAGVSCLTASTGAQEIIRRVPVKEGLAAHPVNGGKCLISDATYQYLAFYDADHRLTVAKRRLGGTEWEFAVTPEKVGWDTHNRAVLFQDRDGYLHLTGNMHNDPLNYYRTQAPRDIQAFEAIHTWAGQYENRVTYPYLLEAADGSLHMMYRHGGSGNGMRLLVHYEEDSQRWVGTGSAFISGMDREPPCNAYPFGSIHEDGNGVWHIAWCWRETPDVVTNFDICYAKSLDNGYTWQRWNGSAYTLPIRPENAEVVEDIAMRSGLMNGGAITTDENGTPYIGYTRFGENEYNQIYVATPVGDEWQIIQVSNFDEHIHFAGRGTIPARPPIPRLHVDQDKQLHVRKGGRELVLSREELLAYEPGALKWQLVEETKLGIPNIRAVNRGPLPDGEQHYMQQEVDRPNRDRKPENPKEPTMIYIVETKLSSE